MRVAAALATSERRKANFMLPDGDVESSCGQGSWIMSDRNISILDVD